MSKTLNEIREEIDSIDNQLHDLLMRRASLVSSVAQAKKKEGLQIVQPAREARMIRRLLSRHEGLLPKSTIVRIWRELVGSVAFLQSGFTVSVCAEDNKCLYWDMAKDYFGSSVPMKKIIGAQSAIAQVMDGKTDFAVVPWPDLNHESAPWWSHLLNTSSDETLSVICALPHGHSKKGEQDSFDRALIISRTEFMDSGDDISFIALEVNKEVSRARIIEHADDIGLDSINLYSAASPHSASYKIYLLEVQGFIASDSNIPARLKDAFGDFCSYCSVVGGYPIIPDVR